MSTQALYNRWRGQTFGDILGQEHITRTLRNQIRAGRIGHAYLFSGLRGTGKTSTARILAKAVNCLGKTDEPPCNQCSACVEITAGRSLDLIEIDAASNRGIDEIRQLRDRVAYAASSLRYKVYIVDEVHMLTTEAFNALLKTLEEPPSHVIFILCTTDLRKVPETIRSRCQSFEFRRGSVRDVAAKLEHICQVEGLSIAPDALMLIARRGAGSFRDAESLLDQLAAFGTEEITLPLVQSMLGSARSGLVEQVVAALLERDAARGLRALNQAVDEGAEPRQVLNEILEWLRALLLLAAAGEDQLDVWGPEELASLRALQRAPTFSLRLVVQAIHLFSDAAQGMRTAARPQLPLELALVEALLGAEATPEPLTPRLTDQVMPRRAEVRTAEARPTERPARTAAEREPVGTAAQGAPASASATPPPVAPVAAVQVPSPPAREEPRQTPVSLPEVAPTPTTAVTSPAGEPALTMDWVQGHWELFKLRVRGRDAKVQALLQDAFPMTLHERTLTVGCSSTFHQGALSAPEKRALVEQVLGEVLGGPVRVEFVVARPKGGVNEGPAGRRPSSRTNDLFTGAPPEAEREAANPGAGETPSLPSMPPKAENNSPEADQIRQTLLNHPVVRDLQRQGARIARVEVYDEDKPKETNGGQG